MNTRKSSTRSSLYGEIQHDNDTFKTMIKHRMKTGSSYRFEFTFQISSYNSDELERGVAFMVETLRSFTQSDLLVKLSVVETSIFPQSMLLIHEWIWSSIQPIIDSVLNDNLHTGLKYSKRELVAFVERLMVVNINGNVSRNLIGKTPKALKVVDHLQTYNWPYLERELINQLDWGIFFTTDTGLMAPDPRSLLLFAFFPKKYRLLCSQNVKTLVDLEMLLIRLEDDETVLDVLNSAVSIFKDMVKNFISEVGTFCCDKLMDKSRRSTSSHLFKRQCYQLDLISKDSFFPSVPNYLADSEISIIHGVTYSAEELWSLHVLQGSYSKMESTPDWFSAYSSLFAFNAQLAEWSIEANRPETYTTIMTNCKGILLLCNQRCVYQHI